MLHQLQASSSSLSFCSHDYLQNIFVPCQEAKEFDDGKNYTFEKYKAMTEKFSKFWFVPSDANEPPKSTNFMLS